MNIRSLHVKLSVSVAAAALFVVMLSSYYFYQRAYESSFAESERSVQQLLETVSTTAAIAAYVNNEELARQVVNGLSINDIVVGAKIQAGDKIIGQQGKTDDKRMQAYISQKLASPFNEREIVGELGVFPNLPLIIMRARDSALATTIGLAAQAAVVALLVLIMVYWLMTRPLARLSRRLHLITPGDGNRVDVAKVHRNDEIGLLAGDINVLLTTVEKMLGEERQLRHRVELLEHRFRGIFEDSSAGIFLISDHGGLVTANPAFFKITGLDEQTPAALADTDIIDQVFLDPEEVHALLASALATQQPCSADLRLAGTGNNTVRWVHGIFSPAGGEKQTPTAEGVIYDVTQRKLDEAQTRELAEKDSLTGLANRQVVEAALEELIEQTVATDKGFVVMMIDLDGFKYINDTYGHDAGDEALRVVATRLRAIVRDTDLVSRLGGDEFFIILKNTNNVVMTRDIARQIIDVQREPVEIQTNIYEKIGASIGIALYPDHGDNGTSLRKHADQAMYSVKHQGKNDYAIYDPEAMWTGKPNN
jgi:diguanylate cyclase (GGDEF)-like protein/PAS domain S-box-containing protein